MFREQLALHLDKRVSMMMTDDEKRCRDCFHSNGDKKAE